MCGRFYLDADTEFLLNYFRIKYEPKIIVEKTVIFPVQNSPVIIEDKGERRIGMMKWGFNSPKNSKPIINSRAETIHEKRMFKESFEKRRCIVPASGFYEWLDNSDQKPKPKYAISLPDMPILSMAGIYTKQIDQTGQLEWHFSIVTREANADMRTIHPRMPLMLSESELSIWLDTGTPLLELDQLLKFDIGKLNVLLEASSQQLSQPPPHQFRLDT